MDLNRRTATITLVAALLWQLYVVGFAWVNAPAFQELFVGLGLSLPLYSQAFFSSYRYWPIVPLLSFVVSIDVLRRATVNSTYHALLLAFTLGSAMLMNVWASEACFRPFSHVSKLVR